MTLEKKAFIIPIFGIFYQSDTQKKPRFWQSRHYVFKVRASQMI